MNPFEAHLKLLRLLPARTHYWRPAASEKGGRPTAEHTRHLSSAIDALRAQGIERREIAKLLGVSLQTVRRHCL